MLIRYRITNHKILFKTSNKPSFQTVSDSVNTRGFLVWIAIEIFNQLEHNELVAAELVSPIWRTFIIEHRFWENLLIKVCILYIAHITGSIANQGRAGYFGTGVFWDKGYFRPFIVLLECFAVPKYPALPYQLKYPAKHIFFCNLQYTTNIKFEACFKYLLFKLNVKKPTENDLAIHIYNKKMCLLTSRLVVQVI